MIAPWRGATTTTTATSTSSLRDALEPHGCVSKVYRNDGLRSFTDIGADLTGVHASSVAWGDYDNDGDLDILLTGDSISGGLSSVYRNDGGGTFTDIRAALTGVLFGSVAWGDYDNDGDLDILFTGSRVINRFQAISEQELESRTRAEAAHWPRCLGNWGRSDPVVDGVRGRPNP